MVKEYNPSIVIGIIRVVNLKHKIEKVGEEC